MQRGATAIYLSEVVNMVMVASFIVSFIIRRGYMEGFRIPLIIVLVVNVLLAGYCLFLMIQNRPNVKRIGLRIFSVSVSLAGSLLLLYMLSCGVW